MQTAHYDHPQCLSPEIVQQIEFHSWGYFFEVRNIATLHMASRHRDEGWSRAVGLWVSMKLLYKATDKHLECLSPSHFCFNSGCTFLGGAQLWHDAFHVGSYFGPYGWLLCHLCVGVGNFGNAFALPSGIKGPCLCDFQGLHLQPAWHRVAV